MICLAICGLAGCAADAPVPGTPVPAAAEIGPEVEAVLARADLVDGVEDRVVSQCAGCGLAMEGKPDRALELGDYSMHFCSDRCRERFENDPVHAVLDLGKLADEAESEP